MTGVGKLLLVLNLLFSVFVCGLIVTVYSTRTSWRTMAETNQKRAQVAVAALQTEKQSREDDRKRLDEQLAAADNAIRQFEEKLREQDKALAALNLEKDKLSTNERQVDSNNKKLVAEVANLRVEREQFQQDKDAQAKINVGLRQRLDDEQKLRVTAEVNYRALQGRNEKLLARNAELEQALTQGRSGVGAAAGALTSGTPVSPGVFAAPSSQAPPQDVFGTVVRVADSGTVQVSVGSDQGLTPNMSLMVYRLNKDNASQSQYLGQLRLTRTEPKQSVGQFTAGQRGARPQPGDEVAYVVSQGNR